LKHYTALTIAAGVLWAATPAFEVASIKAAQPVNPIEVMHGNVLVGMKMDGVRVDIANLTLMDLIRMAYEVKPYQMAASERVKGGERWDIQAKLPEGATAAQIPAMLQALLAERFKLAAHRETREHPVYALVVGKSGAKMKEADPPNAGTETGEKSPHEAMMAGHGRAAGVHVNGGAMSLFLSNEDLGQVRLSPSPSGAGMRLEAKAASMRALADILSRMLDRPVVDKTELKGKYEVAVDLTQENMRTMAATAGFAMPRMGPGGMGPEGDMHGGGDSATASEPAATLFQSVQQLGLRLEARKAPMEMIVVDHVDNSPTEN
jgi:uncharacterized protein (TIGR03435 family)